MNTCESESCSNLPMDNSKFCMKCAMYLDKDKHAKWSTTHKILIPKLDGFPADKIADRTMGWFRLGEGDLQLVCGKCKNIHILTNHEVNAKGECQPSIVCHDDKCGWHVFGVLQDWVPALRLDSASLHNMRAHSGDPLVQLLATEVLELRVKVHDLNKEVKPRFSKLVAYACLMHGLRNNIADQFDVLPADVGLWAMGEMPLDQKVVNTVQPYIINKIQALEEARRRP